ncbi:MAG: hypothetical protein ABI333_15455 [bacterium]
MRFMILAALLICLAPAPLGCMSKRAKMCLEKAKKAKKAGGKEMVGDAYNFCKMSCTHDKNKEVCQARDDLKKLKDLFNKKK